MGQEHQEVRRAAAKAFIESLEQLHQTFESPNGQATPPTSHARNGRHSTTSVDSPTQLDLNSFEDAIADIEQFIQKQKDEGKD
ncbi:MAG: hypothetical protein HC866_22335 [Leptolyngbyaceae cyanobacterium RU_5_1]|nr:hypothetical protein [Leptolyngbyaceae cyanobacterium RU_5_1]